MLEHLKRIKFFVIIFIFFCIKAVFPVNEDLTYETLNNGIKVIIREDHHRDIVALSLIYRIGLIQESDITSGTISFIQSLMKDKIYDEECFLLEENNCSVNTGATPDVAEFTGLSDAKNFPFLVKLISDELKKADFTEDDVEKQKKESISLLESQKGSFDDVYNFFLQNFYRYHPYRQPPSGTPSTINKLNSASVNSFYQKFYIPDNMVISVVGNINRYEVLNLIKKNFQNMESKPIISEKIDWEPPKKENVLYLDTYTNTAWIMVGYPAPPVSSPDYLAAKVLENIFSDGMSSRIWTDLREKEGLAYDLGSIFPDLTGPSHFIAYVITSPEKIYMTKKLLLNEFVRLRKDGVTQQELELGKQKLTGKYLLSHERCQDQAYQLALSEALGLGYRYDTRFLDNLDDITTEDIKDVANRYFNNYTMIIASPPMQDLRLYM